ncbi:MAG: class I SAM-dependent methyltransferase [Gammaproteobacteria bacterium]|nr:class I SAM-dependent methyltransferase [Gammaproteobacteria bacterium]MDH3536275.1 class I SAM-dependent methyltransferase [Gammaproteobacteria bacterium]
MNRPFAESAEQNKHVIYDVIEPYLNGDVLEIGSGTGQHAVFFASQSPAISWQATDLESSLPGIEAWIEASGLDNLPPPLALDVLGDWPDRGYDVIYSANCFHIMGAPEVAGCIAGVGGCLRAGGVFAVYGPFNYQGRYTSESNARFDQMLKKRDPASGIRDFDWLDGLARNAGLELIEDVPMPANNRILIWQKRT